MKKVEEEDDCPMEEEDLSLGQEEIPALDLASFSVTVGELPHEQRTPTRIAPVRFHVSFRVFACFFISYNYCMLFLYSLIRWLAL